MKALSEEFSEHRHIHACEILRPGTSEVAVVFRLASKQDASWFIDKLNGNIPLGLVNAVLVRLAKPDEVGALVGKHDESGGNDVTPSASEHASDDDEEQKNDEEHMSEDDEEQNNNDEEQSYGKHMILSQSPSPRVELHGVPW